MFGLMRKQAERKAKSAGVVSSADLHIQKEISRLGEDLSLPDYMKISYVNKDDETLNKYKLFYVDISVNEGRYAGGSYRMQVDLRNEPEYPTRPPKVTMITKVLHVNIKENSICHSILKVDGDENAAWTPVFGLQGLLIGVATLFFPGGENPSDPLDVEAAQLFSKSPAEYDRKVRDFVKLYAQPRE